MKIVAFIMAFLILALSLLPCADTNTLSGADKATTQISKTSGDCTDPQQDDCSPFCSCACCASYSIHHHSSHLVSLPLVPGKTAGVFVSPDAVGAAYVYWQPPRSC